MAVEALFQNRTPLDEIFRVVLGITNVGVSRRAIEDFTTGSSGRFRDLALTIGDRPLAFTEDGAGHLQLTGGRTNIVSPPKAQDASAAGTMYRNGGGQIYKKLVVNTRDEETLKEFFLEVYIALVLRSVNPHICIPINVFRNDAIKRNARSSTERARAAGQGSSPTEEALFILMNTVPNNINRHYNLESQTRSYLDITIDIIEQLALILIDLEAVRFFHNDLHTGNVLFTEGGQLTLIDFGRSSVIVGGQLYGEPDDNAIRRRMPCDLPTFLIHLYEILSLRRPASLESMTFIRDLFETPLENILSYTRILTTRNITAGNIMQHHYLYYPWVVLEPGYASHRYGPTWDAAHAAAFEACPTIKPRGALMEIARIRAAAAAPAAPAAAAAAPAAPAAAAAAPAAAAPAALRQRAAFASPQLRGEAPPDVSAFLPKSKSGSVCCSGRGQSGCVICGGGKKRKTRTRNTKKRKTLRKKRRTLFRPMDILNRHFMN